MQTTTDTIGITTQMELKDDKLGVVCCYFNPCNYLSRYINFVSFHQKISEQDDIELVVVESYSDDAKYRASNIHKNTISLQSNEVYWQKEQLLNIGIRDLYKRGYKYIAWVDADILFSNHDWVTKSIKSIKKHKVVQLFETCIKLLPSNKSCVMKSTSYYFNNTKPELHKILKRPGEPGYAYGYHRDVLEHFYLYENAIVGTGDFLNLLGCVYSKDELIPTIKDDRFFKGTTSEFLNDYLDWVDRNYTKINKVSFAPNTIYVEYHGTFTKRKYQSRESIIKRTMYNPKKDLLPTSSGLYTLNNKELKSEIRTYFKTRDEDGFIGVINKNLSYRNKILKLILKKNPEYDVTKLETDNLHELQLKKQITSRMPKINKNLKVGIVASKTKEEYFAIKRIVADFHVVVDKSPHPNSSTLISNIGSGDAETYLNFIVTNYDNIPDVVVFLSDKLKISDNSYQKTINTLITDATNETRLTYITTGFKNFYVNDDTHIKDYEKHNVVDSHHNYINWVTKYIPTQSVTLLKRTIGKKTNNVVIHDGVQLRYNINNSFFVGRDCILKKEKAFYETLHGRLINLHDSEEADYINRSWELILT